MNTKLNFDFLYIHGKNPSESGRTFKTIFDFEGPAKIHEAEKDDPTTEAGMAGKVLTDVPPGTTPSKILKYFSPELQNKMYAITIGRHSGKSNNSKSLEVEQLMTEYNVPYTKLGSATNRLGIQIAGYAFLIALDRDGLFDNITEFAISSDICRDAVKVYECNKLICVSELVTPITQQEFHVESYKLREILKRYDRGYILGDVGTISKNYLNWGRRDDGSPVMLDLGYIYPVPVDLLSCSICDHQLGYNNDYTHFVCRSCGRKYTFIEVIRNFGRENLRDDIYNQYENKTDVTDIININTIPEKVEEDNSMFSKQYEQSNTELFDLGYLEDRQDRDIEEFQERYSGSKVTDINNLEPGDEMTPEERLQPLFDARDKAIAAEHNMTIEEYAEMIASKEKEELKRIDDEVAVNKILNDIISRFANEVASVKFKKLPNSMPESMRRKVYTDGFETVRDELYVKMVKAGDNSDFVELKKWYILNEVNGTVTQKAIDTLRVSVLDKYQRTYDSSLEDEGIITDFWLFINNQFGDTSTPSQLEEVEDDSDGDLENYYQTKNEVDGGYVDEIFYGDDDTDDEVFDGDDDEPDVEDETDDDEDIPEDVSDDETDDEPVDGDEDDLLDEDASDDDETDDEVFDGDDDEPADGDNIQDMIEKNKFVQPEGRKFTNFHPSTIIYRDDATVEFSGEDKDEIDLSTDDELDEIFNDKK